MPTDHTATIRIGYTRARKSSHTGQQGVVEIKIILRDTTKGPTLSMMGAVWNALGTDWECGGQNHDSIIDEVHTWVVPRAQAEQMLAIWRRWHLNDMRAGCEHQRALGWNSYDEHPSEPCPTCGYKYGTAWLYEPIPEEIITTIMSWGATQH